MDDVSAYDVANANLQLAIDFSKNFCNNDKVAILLPDEAELDIALEKLGTNQPHPGITVSSLRKSKEGDDRIFKPEQVLLSLFGNGSGGTVQALPDTGMYVCIVASAQELPDIEELHSLDPNATIVFYNMKLDVLRGDLGAPAFPSKVRDCSVYGVLICAVVILCAQLFCFVGLSRSLLEQGQARVLFENSPVQSVHSQPALFGEFPGLSLSIVPRSVPDFVGYRQWQVPPCARQ